MPAFPIYVLQDGRDFYVYRDEKCVTLIPSLSRTAPFPVPVFDIEAAKRARKWFLGLCSANQVIHWPNPFGSDES